MDKSLSQKQKDAYKKRVLKVLVEQDFIIGDKEKDIIEKRTNGRRYFFMVAKRKEGGEIVDRFIKIPQNDTKKLLEPFTRQIEFAKYIKDHTDLSTRGVVDSNTNPKKGVPFAIMETFPIGHAKIGFIESNNGTELLGGEEARNVVIDLQKFHDIDYKKLPTKLKKIIKVRDRGKGFEYIRRSVGKALKKKVLPLDAKNNERELLHELLERRLGIKDFKKKIVEILNKIEPIANKKINQGKFVIHGDMAPNNLYVFDGGKVEFLDLEWVGMFENRVVAMVFDFGNMRARAWKNKNFREEMDKALLDIYRSKGEEEVAKAIICLSILRSNIRFSGYFENYPWDKQALSEETKRREVAEEEINKIWDFNFSK